MFRRRKRIKKRRQITETIAVDGTEVIIYSDKPIDREKENIAKYAKSVVGIEEEYDAMETLINYDFFEGSAKVRIREEQDKIAVYIKRRSRHDKKTSFCKKNEKNTKKIKKS